MRRAPLRAELSGAAALVLAIAAGIAYWRTGEGPYGGAALALVAAALLLARPIRD